MYKEMCMIPGNLDQKPARTHLVADKAFELPHRPRHERQIDVSQQSSRAEESHPHPLLDPDVNVAIHPAPGVQPCFKCPVRE
jgi:hypothetical protein